MPVTYYGLGGHKRLNEIVIAGSHDAGITSGMGFAKTQDLTIGAQAAAGVRFFDLRIAAAVTKSNWRGKAQEVELKAYHGGLSKTKNANVNVPSYRPQGNSAYNPSAVSPGVNASLTVAKAKPGTAFGEGLQGMLAQARGFVESDAGKDEFLILKFDKCHNWGLIGEVCREVLGDRIYTGGGNLNMRTLDQLRGKVVTLFSPQGMAEMGGFGAPHGMLPFKKLADGDAAYESSFHGLQYYGSGGTNPVNEINKIGQNIKKQNKLMFKGLLLGNPDIVGMIYWTTTGSIWNIKGRNEGMWKASNVQKFHDLWTAGLGVYLDSAITVPMPDGSPALGPARKKFMPNIVMIDFANADRCQVIRDLNDGAPQTLGKLA